MTHVPQLGISVPSKKLKSAHCLVIIKLWLPLPMAILLFLLHVCFSQSSWLDVKDYWDNSLLLHVWTCISTLCHKISRLNVLLGAFLKFSCLLHNWECPWSLNSYCGAYSKDQHLIVSCINELLSRGDSTSMFKPIKWSKNSITSFIKTRIWAVIMNKFINEWIKRHPCYFVLLLLTAIIS